MKPRGANSKYAIHSAGRFRGLLPPPAVFKVPVGVFPSHMTPMDTAGQLEGLGSSLGPSLGGVGAVKLFSSL